MRAFLTAAAHEPAPRFRLFYNFVCYAIAGIFLVVGGGYLFGAASAANSPTLHLVLNIERSYRVHGAIMCVLALVLIRGLPEHGRWTRLALIALTFYSSYIALMIVGGFWLVSVAFGAPFWYLLVTILSLGLLWFAPPLEGDGLPVRGDHGGP